MSRTRIVICARGGGINPFIFYKESHHNSGGSISVSLSVTSWHGIGAIKANQVLKYIPEWVKLLKYPSYQWGTLLEIGDRSFYI